MADGVFTIPMSEYYSKSSEFKGKVSDLITDVENNFLSKVSTNIDTLDEQDISVVEGFASYTSAKSKLETLKEYETQLTKMSTEGDSNPLNGVVSLDKQYSAKFLDVSKGADSQTVASAISGIDRNIATDKFIRELQELIKKFGNDFTNNALIKGLIELAKANPVKALEKFLSEPNFQKILEQDGKATSILWSILYKIDDWTRLGNFEKVIDVIFNNKTIVNILDRAPTVIQDKVLNALIRIAKTDGWKLLDKGKKVADWIGKIAELQPVKWVTALANTQIGKSVLNPWVTFLLSSGISSINEYTDPNSRGHNHMGKAITGGTIDTVLSMGPVEGALIGAQFGPGAAIGGGIIGGANTIVQAIFPDMKKNTKNWVYDRIDDLGDPNSLTYKIFKANIDASLPISFPILDNLFGS